MFMIWDFPNVIKRFICFLKREYQEQIQWFGGYLALFHAVKQGNTSWLFDRKEEILLFSLWQERCQCQGVVMLLFYFQGPWSIAKNTQSCLLALVELSPYSSFLYRRTKISHSHTNGICFKKCSYSRHY